MHGAQFDIALAGIIPLRALFVYGVRLTLSNRRVLVIRRDCPTRVHIHLQGPCNQLDLGSTKRRNRYSDALAPETILPDVERPPSLHQTTLATTLPELST